MAEREVSYESLKNRWQREVSTGPQELTRLAPSFYERVEDYLGELEEEYQREHEIDPTSGKAMLLQDELFNLRKILEDLYEQRERKVLLLALAAARGGDPDRTNMTDGEEALFESVVEALDEGRRRILHRPDRDLEGDAPKATTVPDERSDPPEEPLDAYDGDADPGDAEADPAPPPPGEATPHPRAADEGPAPEAAPAPEGGPEAGVEPEPADEAPAARPQGSDGDADGGPATDASGPSTEQEDPAAAAREAGSRDDEAAVPPGVDEEGRVVVRVTETVDAFAASDMRTYDLEAEDVACLPPNAAQALVDRDKAELLGGRPEA